MLLSPYSWCALSAQAGPEWQGSKNSRESKNFLQTHLSPQAKSEIAVD